ncbi:uncharacterized protein [Parasteatoda tepidariorum]|nr:uncharacterized protein LOC107456218 [Parasteatoda tepidariorum]
MNISVFLLTLLVISSIEADQRLYCVSWAGMIRELVHGPQQVNCTVNTNCTGISCSIHEFGYDITGGLSVNACETPTSVTLNIDVPKLNIRNWQKKFYHGDKFSLTETLDGVIDVLKQKDKYILSLALDIPSGLKSDSPLLHYLIPSMASSTRYQVFKNVSVFVPDCKLLNNSGNSTEPSAVTSNVLPLLSSKYKTHSNCTILNSSCPVNEMCLQISKSGPEGFCVCLTDFTRDINGTCIMNPTVSTTVETPAEHLHPNKKTSTKSLLLTAILVPISVIVIAVALVYITIRYRVFQHLRRRLRVQVYEHVLLGQEEDDDEESLNPVA